MSDISPTEQSDVWRVQISNGEVRTGTLDDLDAAFQSGAISVDTLVLGPGQSAWARLGDVAGLDEPAEPAPVPVVVPVAAAVPIVASVAPPSLSGAGLNSVRPVVTEAVDLDFDAPQFKRSKSRGLVYAIVGLVLVGGGVAAFTSTGSGTASGAGAEAAAAVVTARPLVVVPPPQAAPTPPPPPADSAAAAGRLTDDQRKALLEGDKGRDAKRKSKLPAPSSGSSSRSSHKSEPSPFHNGGNPHDPLNGAL